MSPIPMGNAGMFAAPTSAGAYGGGFSPRSFGSFGRGMFAPRQAGFNSSPPPMPQKSVPYQMQDPNVAGTGGMHPYQPTMSQPYQASDPTAISQPPLGMPAASMQDPAAMMKMQAQNIGGWGGLKKSFAPVAQDSVGVNRYMQNGQFDSGTAINDYYSALEKLRSQGVTGQINLYDRFKNPDGSYGGPFNNGMINDYRGGYQTAGPMGNWTGKRNGKNYWLGSEVDDMTFNERFKQGI